MKITKIRIGRSDTIKIQGFDYENVKPHVEVEAELEDDESYAAAYKKLSATVNALFEKEASIQLQDFLESRSSD